jgi:renalase
MSTVTEQETIRNIIVGAGIAGLTLARELSSQKTLILEKSKGIGGRVATRREGDFTFDHGAQFYASTELTNLVNPTKEFEIIEPWFEKNGLKHQTVRGGLTGFAKAIYSKEQVLLNHHVDRLTSEENVWILSTQAGQKMQGQKVFLTCPLPQTLQLLDTSGISYPPELMQFSYTKALVGLFGLRDLGLRAQSIRHLENVSTEIFSITNQKSKGVSLNDAFVVVMQPDWSEAYFDRDESLVLEVISSIFKNYMLDEFSDSIQTELSLLKKWRYCLPSYVLSTPFLQVHPGLYILGDAFGGPTIFGARRSALAVAQSLKNQKS